VTYDNPDFGIKLEYPFAWLRFPPSVLKDGEVAKFAPLNISGTALVAVYQNDLEEKHISLHHLLKNQISSHSNLKNFKVLEKH